MCPHRRLLVVTPTLIRVREIQSTPSLLRRVRDSHGPTMLAMRLAPVVVPGRTLSITTTIAAALHTDLFLAEGRIWARPLSPLPMYDYTTLDYKHNSWHMPAVD